MRITPIRFGLLIVPLFLLQATELLQVTEFVQAQTLPKYGTAEVHKGPPTAFFSDWDLCTDNSNNTAVDQPALQAGQAYFQGSMDKYGRIIELRYYDLNWIHRWTKRFAYGRQGQYRYGYFAANGQPINYRKQEARVRKHYVQPAGISKDQVRGILGDPLIIQLDAWGMEKWRYFDGLEQHWYIFNAKGELDYSNYRQ